MLFSPTARNGEISGGGGTSTFRASSVTDSCRFRFRLLLPLEEGMWLERYCPTGERRLGSRQACFVLDLGLLSEATTIVLGNANDGSKVIGVPLTCRELL
jgi:hypothetical protein